MAKLLVSVRNSGNRSLAHINPQIRKFCPTSLLWIAIQIANVRTISKYAIKSSKLILCHQLGSCDQFSSVQSLSRVQLFVIPWTAAYQASLSINNSWSLFKLMFTELVTPSNHPILCCPLLLPPSIFSSIRVFSRESVLCIRWPKYWRFGISISPSNEYSGLISFRMD